jgi:pimeloyl-ACP methyl ester carboxylesterase
LFLDRIVAARETFDKIRETPMHEPPPKPILLVHGAWHGAWCWRPLLGALKSRGRAAYALDMPGAGADRTDPTDVTLQDCARRVVEAARAFGRPIMLVGHSMGGMVITLAAELAPALFSELVYVTAIVPGHGESALMITASGAAPAEAVPALSADGRLLDPPGAAREIFYHDCPEALVADALTRLKPIAAPFLFSPVQLPVNHAARLPRHYVECLDDRILSIEMQRSIVAARGGMRVYTLLSGHSPFFSMPDELADILVGIE